MRRLVLFCGVSLVVFPGATARTEISLRKFAPPVRGYVMNVDMGKAYRGEPTLVIRATPDAVPGRRGIARWTISATAYRGHRIRLRAVAATRDAERAGIWLLALGPTKAPFDNSAYSFRTLHGTTTWRAVDAEIDVPADATTIAGGVVLDSIHGALRTTAPSLTILGKNSRANEPRSREVAGAPTTIPVPARPLRQDPIVDDLRGYSVPLDTLNPDAPTTDLEPLERAIGPARIVGMGEATHGTADFAAMKDRVFRAIALRKGFRLFAIEANMAETRRLERYVTTGQGSAEAALQWTRVPFWDTKELLELVRWIRGYDATPGHQRIHIAGFDMQYATTAADDVVQFAHHRAPKIASSIDTAYNCVWRTADGARLAVEIASSCERDVARAATLLSSLRPNADIRRDASVVMQWARLASSRDLETYINRRDEAMAANVAWLANVRYPGAKVALWAHNYHISNTQNGVIRSMGAWLKSWYGSSYYRLGFAFYEGMVLAGRPDGVLAVQDVGPARPDAMESVLRDVGPLLFIDLDRMRSGPARDWLDAGVREREVAADYDPAAPEASYIPDAQVRQRFDGLVFVARSHASTLLPVGGE